MSKLLKEIKGIADDSEEILKDIKHEKYGRIPGLIERIISLDTKQIKDINRTFGFTLLQKKYARFAKEIFSEAQEALKDIKTITPENLAKVVYHIEKIRQIADYEHRIVEMKEEHEIPGNAPMYGRIVNKRSMKLMKKSGYLVAKRIHELIPAFMMPDDALGRLYKKLEKGKTRDLLKQMHKKTGGSGEGDYLVLFRTDIKPQTAGIPLRDPLVSWLKEAKFWSGTKIRIVEIIH